MAANEEQESLLQNVYHGEKDPETKDSQKDEDVVEGVPLHPGNSMNPAVSRTPWSSSIFACLGSNDEFFSSDLEVCALGTCAPCLLYASNVERLNPTAEATFANHCMSYTGLFFLGNFIFGGNVLAPCFSYTNRSDIRRKYNLEGTGEWFARSCGCCTSLMESEHRERCESLCDFTAHYVCHSCALCQEGREIRRRVPHPGFIRPYMPMNAPMEQAMTT